VLEEARTRFAALERDLRQAGRAALDGALSKVSALEGQLRAAKESSEVERSRSKGGVARAAAELSHCAAERASLERARDQLSKELDDRHAELAAVREQEVARAQHDAGAAHEAERLRGDKLRLEGALQRAEARLRELQLTSDARADQLARAEADARELVERSKAEEATRLGAHQRELALVEDRLRLLRAEHETARDEVTALRGQAEEVRRLSEELAGAQAEVRRLQALGFASAAPRWRAAGEAPVAAPGEHLTEALQAAVRDALGTGASSAVVSDEQGLVIAGAGEHAEALAAIGALLLQLSERAEGLLPVQGLASARVTDVNGATVEAKGFTEGPMLLVTLGVRATGGDP
jgi:chromosome segregation ATPase